MGILDILILCFLLYLCWRGWRKGLISMVLQFVGVILVFFLIAHYFPLVKNGIVLKLHLGTVLSTILAVILIVAAIIIVVQLVRLLLEKTLKLMHVSFLNSALGTLVGFLTGLLAVVVFSILIEAIPPFRSSLSNPQKHRVYAIVQVVRNELYDAFKLKEKYPAAAKIIDTEKPLPNRQK